MRYQSTVFGQLLKAVPRGWFDRTARLLRVGRRKHALNEWGHLVAMVGAQLTGARSLRDLERVLDRHPGVLAHLGFVGAARSTLADANANRPVALFEAVAGKLCSAFAGRSVGAQALRLIDATRIYAGKRVEAWAKGAVKLHLGLDPRQQRPTWFAVTSERVNDITAAKAMPVEAGATYVFDKGYYDFAFWATLDAAGCRFVTRLKRNSPTTLVRRRRVRDAGVLFDRVVTLSQRLGGQRRNPFQGEVRLIGVQLNAGREITLLTNDLTTSAGEIAELYKARWQVELFFKWIKQNLKLAHFFGTSRNALTIQIMAALIAYLLLRLANVAQPAGLGLQALARLMPALLFARRPLAAIMTGQPPPIQTLTSRQCELTYA